jgi:hypothetical protein
MRCCHCNRALDESDIAPSHLNKKWYICRKCSARAKQKWRKENEELNKKQRRKDRAKRQRDLGYTELIPNPFHESEEIEWHHLDNTYVVALPKDLHQLFIRKSRLEHRDLLESIVIQIYGYAAAKVMVTPPV